MTYVECLALTRDDLFDCAEEFPEAEARIRRAALRLTMVRLLLKCDRSCHRHARR